LPLDGLTEIVTIVINCEPVCILWWF